MIGALCGLKSEAALLAPLVRSGRALVLPSGADSARAAQAAERLVAGGATALLSFGLCGALGASVSSGDLVLPDEVLAEGGEPSLWPCDQDWRRRLLAALPPPLLERTKAGRLLGADRAIATAAEKTAAEKRYAALSVDMESHALARTAARHALPFLVLRACSDEADQDLPEAALRATRPDGSIALAPLVASLCLRPRQLAGLIALGRGSKLAHACLARAVESGGLLQDDA